MPIEKIKFFLSFLICLVIFNEAYAFNKNSVKKINLNIVHDTTSVTTDQNGNIWQIFHNEITFFNDNTIVVPIIAYNLNQKKYNTSTLNYIYVDCRAPGAIIYNSDLDKPTSLQSNTAGGAIKKYFCKSKVENENIIWVSTFVDEKGGFDPYVLFLDNLKQTNKVITFNYSAFNRDSNTFKGIIGKEKKAQGKINCEQNSFSSGEVLKNYSDKTSHDLHFLMDTVCGRNNILKINNISINKEAVTSNVAEECAALGFKKGTQNYEKCVLQLLGK